MKWSRVGRARSQAAGAGGIKREARAGGCGRLRSIGAHFGRKVAASLTQPICAGRFHWREQIIDRFALLAGRFDWSAAAAAAAIASAAAPAAAAQLSAPKPSLIGGARFKRAERGKANKGGADQRQLSYCGRR